MSKGDEGLDRFFKHILLKNISEAKVELEPNAELKRGVFGRYMAAKGMLALLEDRSGNKSLLEDGEKLDRLQSLLKDKGGSIWCDDFDREYFDTWIKFIDYSKRNRLQLTGSEEGVDENPGEEEEHNKAH